MTEQAGRGAEAYSQAYEYITQGNPGRSARWCRRMAARYLAVTASPPLTRQERRAARRARRATRPLNPQT
jgi:alkanesulfonate monooxygenase SsuD/methylene tetrahydromethanopterin reductase-like flavin-dependent oxidoreductase (luciferase family)